MAFRMVWFDPRIIVDLNDTRKFVHWYRDQRDIFWFPDLYILNSIDIGVPKLTLDPILLRVYKDGKVESSIRKEIQSVCPMDFINYPVRNTSSTYSYYFDSKTKQNNCRWMSSSANLGLNHGAQLQMK